MRSKKQMKMLGGPRVIDQPSTANRKRMTVTTSISTDSLSAVDKISKHFNMPKSEVYDLAVRCLADTVKVPDPPELPEKYKNLMSSSSTQS